MMRCTHLQVLLQMPPKWCEGPGANNHGVHYITTVGRRPGGGKRHDSEEKHDLRSPMLQPHMRYPASLPSLARRNLVSMLRSSVGNVQPKSMDLLRRDT